MCGIPGQPISQERSVVINVADLGMGDVVKDIAMGRLGEPGEFSAMVVFLASERSSFISGAAFPVDGGELNAI